MIKVKSLILLLLLSLSTGTIYAGDCIESGKTASAKAHTVSSAPDIVDVAVKSADFKILVKALKAAGLVDALKSPGKFTVFAPTDAAFAKLPKGTLEMLLKPENKDMLVNILTYHVVSGAVPFKDAVGLNSATALNKQKIAVAVKNGSLYLNESRVVNNDIQTSNGIIHVINAVLLPPTSTAKSPAMRIIASAIEKGVSLFNMGQHKACADIYELAVESLLLMDKEKVNNHSKKVLRDAMNTAAHSNSDTKRAWTMRLALDKVTQMMN